jgi:predicted NAD-dependent protein-ADP-ribosyltransferase YbiA (DUF1768 family)
MDTDPVLAEHIRRLPTARMAQQEARKYAHRQRADWLDINIAMMDKVLLAKFSQHRPLRHMLRNTGERELIEDSPVRAHLQVLALRAKSCRRMTGFGELEGTIGAVMSSVKH